MRPTDADRAHSDAAGAPVSFDRAAEERVSVNAVSVQERSVQAGSVKESSVNKGSLPALDAESGSAVAPSAADSLRRVFWATNSKARHTRAQVALLQPKMDAIGAQALRVVRPAEWVRELTDACFTRDDLLVVHGGDGTLQVIVSALGAVLPVAAWPMLAILPAGGTNMTAYDGGGRQTFAQALRGLEDVLAGHRAWTARERFVIAARDEQQLRFGFFFGAGVIVQGIQFYHQEIARGAVGDEFASGLTLLRGAWGIARREPRFTATSRAQFTANGVAVDDDLLMLFSTTLDRMFMGITPWWGDGRGGMHTTWIHSRVKRFFWRLPRLVRHGRGLTPAMGYNSHDLDVLRLRLNGPYTLDGELFAVPNGELELRAEGPVRILTLVGPENGHGS